MERHFFLDLEDTLIAPVMQWSQAELLNQRGDWSEIPRPVRGLRPCWSDQFITDKALNGSFRNWANHQSEIGLVRTLIESSRGEVSGARIEGETLEQVNHGDPIWRSPWQQQSNARVHLFSFALHNDRELGLFNQHIADFLWGKLGVQAELTPVLDRDVIPACARERGITPSLLTQSELIDFWGKDRAFEDWIKECLRRWNQKDGPRRRQCILIDDAVEAQRIVWPNWNVEIVMLHPGDIVDWMTWGEQVFFQSTI